MRAYVIPVRSDCPGAGLQVQDLVPNTSSKNSIYDGPGQTFYLHGADFPGATVVSGNAYASGSRMTALVAGDDATVQDTTGGGNNVRATAKAQFGLAAYLRERVQPGGLGLATADSMAPADAQAAATAILGMAYVGAPLTTVDIDSMLSAIVTPSTDLEGSGTSRSFGTVEEILQILSGSVYLVPSQTIITNIVGGPAYQFQTKAQRDVFVAAQVTATTGKTFVSKGRFLTRGEHGFLELPEVALTGDVVASAGAGNLHAFANPVKFKNPSFGYTALEVSAGKPPAGRWNNTFVPATGISLACHTYDNLGNLLG